MDIDGSNITQLTNFENGECYDVNPVISSDGSQILFSCYGNNITDQIFIMDNDGGNLMNLSNNNNYYSDHSPQFQPY